MKVILQQDVARLGKRFEVVNVPDGHALNKLIPQGMALPATPANLKQAEARAARKEAAAADVSEVFAAASEKLQGTTQTLAIEANEHGHLFQAVKPEQVVEVASAAGATLLPEQIQITDTIKEVGEYSVTISDGEQEANFTLQVEAK